MQLDYIVQSQTTLTFLQVAPRHPVGHILLQWCPHADIEVIKVVLHPTGTVLAVVRGRGRGAVLCFNCLLWRGWQRG